MRTARGCTNKRMHTQPFEGCTHSTAHWKGNAECLGRCRCSDGNGNGRMSLDSMIKLRRYLELLWEGRREIEVMA